MKNQVGKNTVSSCGDDLIFGGYGVFGERALISKQWVNLPPHFKAIVKFNFFKIDSWDNESFLVYSDGELVHESKYKYQIIEIYYRHGINVGSNICGAVHKHWTDQKIPVSLTIDHTSANLVIVMTTSLNQQALDESWGINNFSLEVQTCPGDCVFCQNNDADACKNMVLAASSWTAENVATEGWTVMKAKKVDTTNCAGSQIFGGFDSFGVGAAISNTFELPVHTKLIVKLQFWRLDSWDGEKAFMILDGVKAWEITDNFQKDGNKNSLCGAANNDWTDSIYNVEVAINHSSSSLTVEISTNLGSDAADESWGVRNFQVFTVNDGINQKLVSSELSANNFLTPEGWTVVNAAQKEVVTDCGSVRLLGGYKVLGKGATVYKQFSLPAHYAVRVQFKLMKIDSWDNHHFYLYADGVDIYKNQYHFTAGTQQCGTDHPNYMEQITTVDQVFEHSAANLVLLMTTNLDENANNESWGIRDFQIYVMECTSDCQVCTGNKDKDCLNWKLYEQSLVDNGDDFGKDSKFEFVGAKSETTKCGSINMLGGHGVLGQKAYIQRKISDLPQHKALRIQLQFWRVDSWDNEWAYIKVNGNEVWKNQFKQYPAGKANICGSQGDSNFVEDIVNINIVVTHDQSDLLLQIGASLDQAPLDESWGIRDFQLYLEDGSLESEDDRDVKASTWDYTAFQANTFKDLDGWTVTGTESKELITNCGQHKLVGGFGVFGAGASMTKMIPLKPHYKLKLKVQVFKIDSWDGEELKIYADGEQVYSKKMVYQTGKQLCGQSHAQWNEDIDVLDVEFAHSSPNVVIVITSTLDQGAHDESWGVKNFRLKSFACPEGCVTCDQKTLAKEECKQWSIVSESFNNPSDDSEGWVVTGAQSKVSQCAGIKLFGGFDVFGKGAAVQKSIASLPVHNMLRLQLQFWKIDSWDNEYAEIVVDGVQIWKKNFIYHQGFPRSICGQSHNQWNEDIFNVDVTFEHTAATANIKVSTTLDQGATDESWAIRDFQLFSIALTGVDDQEIDDPQIFYKAFQGNNFAGLDGWTANRPYDENIFTSCMGTRLVGGFGVFGKGSSLVKEIALPPHYAIEVRFQLYKIDSWDGEEFQVYADGNQIYKQALTYSQGAQVCGQQHNQWNEQTIRVKAKANHSGPTLTIVLTSKLDQAAKDESWGIRNFQLVVFKCPDGCEICSEKDTINKCKNWSVVQSDFVSASQEKAEGWNVEGAVAQFTNCAGIQVFGGFSVFGKGTQISKSYELPPHNKLLVKAQFWKIDSWDGELAQLLVDSESVWEQKMVYNQGFPTSLCGSHADNWNEMIVDIEVLLDHVESTVKLTFKTGLDQAKEDESWGVRNIQLIVPNLVELTADEILIKDKTLVYSSFTDNKFTEASGWVSINPMVADQSITSCGGTRIFGGFKVFGKEGAASLFKVLPPHYSIKIQLTVFQIDSWDKEDFQVYVDGALVHSEKYQFGEGQQACGAKPSSWKDQQKKIVVVVPHNAPNVEIVLSSNVNQPASDESWGFRDFYLFVDECPEGCDICTQATLKTCQNLKFISQSWIDEKPLQADSWNVAGSEAKGSVCGGINIFGGFNLFGKGASITKTFDQLPPHNHLFISFQFWKIDSWDGEKAELVLDGKNVWSASLMYTQGINICGQKHNQWNELVQNIAIRVDHADSTASLAFTSTLDQAANDESWGIRNFQLFYTQIEEQITLPKAHYVAFFGQLFNDVDGWVATAAATDKLFTACGDVRVLGGFGVLGAKASLSKTFQLPPHSKLSIKFNFLKIDSWDNQSFYVFVDGKQVFSKQLGLDDGSQMCGVRSGRWLEQLVAVDLSPVHNSPSATIVITTNLDEAATNESWGINNFVLDYEACPEKCVTCDDKDQKTCNIWTLAGESLREYDQKKFDVSKWTVTNANGKEFVTNCIGASLLGGFDVFGVKAAAEVQFTKIPTHNIVKLKLQFWKFDSWDNEVFKIMVDEELVFQKSFNHNGFTNSICGQKHANWNEQVENIEVEFNHIGETLKLKLTSNLNQAADDESWGVRDVQLFVQQLPEQSQADQQSQNDKHFSSSFNSQTFKDNDGWSVLNSAQSNSKDLVTSCGENRVFGGYKVLGKKASISKQFSLPPHYQLRIKFNFLKIDSWENHNFIVYVDGNIVKNQKLGLKGGAQQCGTAGNLHLEEMVTVELTVPHNSATAVFLITTTLNEAVSNESWGIRDFSLDIDQCPEKCSICTESTKDVCLNWTKVAETLTEMDSKKFGITGWKIENAKGKDFTTECAGVSILGGFNVFGQKAAAVYEFTQLPIHNKAKLRLQFWKIDSWDDEFFQVFADGQILSQQKFTYHAGFKNSLCGSGKANWNEQIENIELDFDHVGSTLELRLTSTLNQDANDESWGVRNVELFFERVPEVTEVESQTKAYYSAFMTNQFEDLDGWSVSMTTNKNIITSCGGERIYGGFNVFGKGSSAIKQIQLPPHSQLLIKFKLYKIDSWDNHNFILFLDGVNVYQEKYQFNQGTDICGHGVHKKWKDQMSIVEVKVPHTATTATIVLTSTLDQAANDESWGIRQFQLFIEGCPESCDVCDKVAKLESGSSLAPTKEKKTCKSWKLIGSSFTDLALKNEEGWTITQGKKGFYTCSGVQVFGGFGNFGKGASISKEFTDLPAHNKIRVKLAFWKFDSWDGEIAQLLADGLVIWSQKLTSSGNFQNSICGSNHKAWQDDLASLDLTIDHASPSVTLLIRTTLDQGAKDESWGVRDIQLFAEPLEEQVIPVNKDAFYGSFFGNTFKELDGWIMNKNNSNTIITACDNVRVVGGYNVLGKGSSLFKHIAVPPHFQVRLKFKLLKIDSWDKEQFLLFVDGEQVYSKQFVASQGMQACGRQNKNWNEHMETIDVTVPHNQPNLLVSMTTTLNQAAGDESWGIREFEVYVSPCPKDCKICTKGDLDNCGIYTLQSQSWTEQKDLKQDGWVVEKGKAGTSSCSGVQIFGGFNVFGKGVQIAKQFTVAPHNKLIVRFQFWKIDSWDNEQLVVSVDNYVVLKKAYRSQGFKVSVCGAGTDKWTEEVENFELVLDHTGLSTVVRITTTLNQKANDESWGIRDLQIFTDSANKIEQKPDEKAVVSDFFGNQFNEAKEWQIIQTKFFQDKILDQQLITSCGGTRMFGGFRVLGRGNAVVRQFVLPPHSSVKISFKLWKIDSWDKEMFYAYADGNEFFKRVFTHIEGKQVCGQQGKNWNEVEIAVEGTIPHNSPTLTLLLTSNINEVSDNESWGLREFQIFVEECPKDCKICTQGNEAAQCKAWNLQTSSWTQVDQLTAEGWQTNNIQDPQQTKCGGVNIFGGYGQFGKDQGLQKVFSELPNHSRIRIQLQLWKIDSWDRHDFQIYVDGKLGFSKNLPTKNSFKTPLCGNPDRTQWLDEVMDIDFEVAHSQPTMTIQFSSTLDQNANDESWGVRDFYLYTDYVDQVVADITKPVYTIATEKDINQDQLKNWAITGQMGKALVSLCGEKQLIGGSGVFGKEASAVYQANLQPHFQVTIRFLLVKIDSWDKEQFLLYVDGRQAYSKYFVMTNGKQLCGSDKNNFFEEEEYIEVSVPHTRQDISIILTSTLNEDALNESWGFRDFSITITPCPEGCSVCNNKNANACKIWKPSAINWQTGNVNADGWTVDKGTAQVTECSSIKLFGGYNAFGAFTSINKKFTDLPTHQRLRLQVQFWKIDSWDNHRASIFVDGREVWGRMIQGSHFVANLCGSQNTGWKDLPIDIDVNFLHDRDTAEIEFRTTLDQPANDESWGVRQFYMYVGQCAEGCFDCSGATKKDCRQPKDTENIYSAFKGEFPDSDIQDWTVSSGYNKNVISKCGNTKMLGGNSVLGKNSMLTRVVQLPPHHLVRVQFNLHKIDSWDNERFMLYVDGLEGYSRVFQVDEGTEQCGSKGTELTVPIDVSFSHNQPSVIVMMQSTLNEVATNESWGISDFVISVARCPKGCSVCNNNNPKNCKLWEPIQPIWDSNSEVPALGWQIEKAYSKQVSTNCGGVVIMGGTTVFGKDSKISKSVTQLPEHDMLRIKLQFWKIDSWDSDIAYIKVDGRVVWARYFNMWGGFSNTVCGASHLGWNEQAVNVDIFHPHSDINALVEITTNLDKISKVSSWGIREFNVFDAQCAKNCIQCRQQNICQRCSQEFVLQNGQCVESQQKLLVSKDFSDQTFTDLQGWSFIGAKGKNTISTCAEVSIAGGFDIFGKGAIASKKFVLSAHTTLRLSVEVWKVDSWDGEEMIIMVDDEIVWRKNFGWDSKGLPQCGQAHNSWFETVEYVDIVVPHTSRAATVTITSTLDQDAADESWGFRNFQLYADSTEDCAYFYSECNYEGDFVKFCRESRNTMKMQFLKKIKSFKIPPQGRVTLFNTAEFEIQTVEVTQNNQCVGEDVQLSLATGSRLLIERNIRRARI